MSPKDRYLQSKEDVAWLASITEHPRFQRAIDHALLQQDYLAGRTDNDILAASEFHRCTGGREFARIFSNLWKIPEPTDKTPEGNLQHRHVPWYQKLAKRK